MSDPTYTRRTVLEAAGASALATTVAGAASAASSEWERVETPVDGTLHDVAYTADGAYAVGDGGVIVERTAAGWETVLRGGPTGNGNDLYGAAVTEGGSASDASGASSDGTSDGGKRLWIAGASGAIGEYDVVTGTLEDRSAPNDQTNNFNDLAVTGAAGDADAYVADDSGAIHYSFANGESGTWEYAVPGSGSGLPAIECYDSRSGVVIDTNGKVFATDDGTTWEPIGIADADVTFYGLDADAADDVTVSGGNGSIFTWNGAQWTPTSVGDPDLRDIETDDGFASDASGTSSEGTSGSGGLAVGGGGVVFAYDGREWTQEQTPTGENLRAVATGSTDLAVGAAGTVLER